MKDIQTSQIEYRLAKPSHGAHLAEMSKRLVEYGLPWWSWTPKRFTRSIKSPDNITLLALQKKQIFGFALMHFAEERAHLNLLAVEPEYQRRGLATGMLRWLEESCAIAGIIRVSLECRETNPQAIAFYEKQGFDVFGKTPNYYCGRETAVRMQKTLSKNDPA